MGSPTRQKPKAMERILARGHENVKATHKSTLEVTKDSYLTPKGNCIIAVSASKAANDLLPSFKYYLRRPGSVLVVILRVGSLQDIVIARGHPDLLLSDPRSIVIRKSSYIDGRTIAIHSNKAAIDINRELIKRLNDRRTVLEVTLLVFDP